VMGQLERLDGREAVLAAAGHHPYVRLTATGEVTGYRGDGLLGWVGMGPWGPVLAALGSPGAALDLADAWRASGAAGGGRWMHLPRIPAADVAAVLPVRRQDDWEFRWTGRVPAPTPGEERVERLGPADDGAVRALLEEAFPQTTSRPGDPRVRVWYGIRDGAGGMVAAGADRSRGGVGFLAGLVVHPAQRRRGLGAALTAAMTRRLHAEFGVVALGVMAHEEGARRLYERLGYADSLARSSVGLLDNDA
jgi:GNAT superfamily N-acetyltransferase